MTARKRSPTIYDLAQALGLSPATVSRGLQGSPLVRDETRERILELARELGYRPNGLARSLTTGRSLTVGMLIGDVVNAFYPELIAAVQVACDQHGYALVLGNTREEVSREESAFGLMVQMQLDGVLLCSPRVPPERLLEWKEQLPIVVINQLPAAPAPAVSVDHAKGARLAASHLLDGGRRRLLFLGGPPSWNACRLREQGLREAVAERDSSVQVLVRYAQASSQGAYSLVRALFAGGARPADGIMAYDDVMAAGALKALAEMGVAVPEAVAVVGFDDAQLATLITPALTTVAQPLTALAEVAMNILLEQMGGTPSAKQVALDPTLVVRSSTTAAALPPLPGRSPREEARC